MITAQLISLGGTILVLLLVVLIFKYFTGKGKPYAERDGLQKIACGLFSIFRSNVEEAATAINTAPVLKEQALHEIDDALKDLNTSFANSQVAAKKELKKLNEDLIPHFSDLPGTLEGKARTYKQKYQASVEKGSPIEEYKKNAIQALQYKLKAISNVEKLKAQAEKLSVNIETAQARYEGDKMDLEMLRADIVSRVDIPQIELQNRITRITSLRDELVDRLDTAEITREVNSTINNSDTSVMSAEATAAFDAL